VTSLHFSVLANDSTGAQIPETQFGFGNGRRPDCPKIDWLTVGQQGPEPDFENYERN
jgi:hypothetical protein